MTDKAAPRRSPEPGDRQRDAERTRHVLLEAAVAEFSAHGFSGARVGDIAARAGVNKQLISYYFGGKQGLFDAISDRWRRDEQGLAGPDTQLSEVVREYARQSARSPDLTRLVLRQGIDGTGGSAGEEEALRARFREVAADFGRRRDAGELAADLDPASVGLALFAMAAAPVGFPHIARALGLDVDAPDFGERYAAQVARIVSLLADGERRPPR
ncbi:TetR/AcrR family transcriptional regulator [Umezawaea tangerina]|uniref:TetR family transcriptional regulator n=1 Tax=Umezawaea tangerina TaxID=84725 RepID=A0A2T0SQN1_9PSEU|nr:TetR family transcriptional regulator [Umezawaea tangerina]PRY35706.1 TetR family transcriptional regulator [Umezawaea tangerina]